MLYRSIPEEINSELILKYYFSHFKTRLMMTHKGYGVLEINGSLLIPEFSIYLLEIINGKNRFFYIGMTGDPFYPSARAAFHRISGHLEKAINSTQNQLWIALRDEAELNDPLEFSKLKIKMHHFPIKGFTTWSGDSMHHDVINQQLNSEEYLSYKKLQTDILTLEKALISEFQSPKLLNRTLGQENKKQLSKYKNIYNDIKHIIETN